MESPIKLKRHFPFLLNPKLPTLRAHAAKLHPTEVAEACLTLALQPHRVTELQEAPSNWGAVLVEPMSCSR